MNDVHVFPGTVDVTSKPDTKHGSSIWITLSVRNEKGIVMTKQLYVSRMTMIMKEERAIYFWNERATSRDGSITTELYRIQPYDGHRCPRPTHGERSTTPVRLP